MYINPLPFIALFFAIVAAIWYAWSQTRKAPPYGTRELLYLPWDQADKRMRAQEGWRIAKEEDRNGVLGMVWIERDVPEDTQ